MPRQIKKDLGRADAFIPMTGGALTELSGRLGLRRSPAMVAARRIASRREYVACIFVVLDLECERARKSCHPIRGARILSGVTNLDQHRPLRTL